MFQYLRQLLRVSTLFYSTLIFCCKHFLHWKCIFANCWLFVFVPTLNIRTRADTSKLLYLYLTHKHQRRWLPVVNPAPGRHGRSPALLQSAVGPLFYWAWCTLAPVPAHVWKLILQSFVHGCTKKISLRKKAIYPLRTDL